MDQNSNVNWKVVQGDCPIKHGPKTPLVNLMLELKMLTKVLVFHLEFPNSWDMFSSPEGASNTVMENVAKLLQTLYSTLLSCGFTSLQCKFVNWSREDGRILYLV